VLADELRLAAFRSALDHRRIAQEAADVSTWIESARRQATMSAERVHLADVLDGEQALEESMVFIDAVIRDREVKHWGQPLMVSPPGNFCGLLLRREGEDVLALVQAVEEPGIIGGVQIGPTVQRGMSFAETPDHGREYAPHFDRPGPEEVVFSVEQSEEGGRFQRDAITYAAVVPANPPDAGDGHRWVSLAALKQAVTKENLLNVHTRTLLCMLT
jgi:oxidase EvaA